MAETARELDFNKPSKQITYSTKLKEKPRKAQRSLLGRAVVSVQVSQ